MFLNHTATTPHMDILEFDKKLRPDAERLHINVDRRHEIIWSAYNFVCDDTFKVTGLNGDIDLIGDSIFSNCGRIRKEAEYFRRVLVLMFQKRCNFDVNIAESIANKGFEKYEQVLKERIPNHASDSEYECLIEDAEELGIDRPRAESLIGVVRQSLMRFFESRAHDDISKVGKDIDKIAMPFTDTCTTPAECKFFSEAVAYLAYENHGREHQFAEELSSFTAQRAVQLFQVKKSQNGGCLAVLGVIGILPLGAYAVTHFLA